LNNYPCKRTNFLQYYQVISAILKRLLTEVKNGELINKELYFYNTSDFQLDELSQINLTKTRTSDFGKLFTTKTYTAKHTGPQKWNNHVSIVSLKTLCKEPKLKEFQFKLMHRIVVTRRKLFRYGIQPDDDCIHCGEKDAISILSSTVFLLKNFHKRLSVGSM